MEEVQTPNITASLNQELLVPQHSKKNKYLFFVIGVISLVLLGSIIWYFSHKTTSTIAGWVFLDENQNEKFDQTEKGLPGFKVSLALFKTVDGLPQPSGILDVVTDNSGHYIIPNIPSDDSSNSYLMGLAPNINYDDVNNKMSFNVKIPPDAIFNFPLKLRTDNQTIESSVFIDKNDNGTRDSDEVGLGNITVGLFKNGSGETQSTKSDGSFTFLQEYSGYYTLSIKIPDGYSTVGSQDGIFLNKLVNVKKGNVVPSIALTPSTSKHTMPGTASSYTLSGVAFEDSNGNGKQDSDENPISGLTFVASQLEPSRLVLTGLSTFMNTDINGYFSSDHPQPQLKKKSLLGGYYQIGWVDNNQYIPTTPNEIFVVLDVDKKMNFGVKKVGGSYTAKTPSSPKTKIVSQPIDDSFSFSINISDVTAKDNDLVQFKGVLTNNTKQDVYLNGISLDTSNQELVADNSNFSTFPTKLKPGESYKGVMFSVYVSQVALAGDYSGSVSFQGGQDANSFDIIGGQAFSIHVIK